MKNLRNKLAGIAMVGGLMAAQVTLAGPSDSKLYGAWQLTKFEIISKNHESQEFCSGMTGKIIYEKSGEMSVSINCAPEADEREPADDYNRMLFYAAKFEIRGDEVVHHIANTSQPSLLGKNLVRKVVRLTDDELVLTGLLGDGSLRIAWRKDRKAISKQSAENVAYITRLKLRPGTQTKFLAEVHKIVEFSRSEPGNIGWFVQQSQEDPTEVIFYTRWVNQAAIDWHLNAPPLKRYIQKSAELLSEPAKLTKYRPLDILN